MQEKKINSESLKFKKVCESLKASILSARYAPGQRIPSQNEICKQYDVSRPTVSKALEYLEKCGFITRKQGSGCYVSTSLKSHSHNKILTLIIGHSSFIPKNFQECVFISIITNITALTAKMGYVLLIDNSIREDEGDITLKNAVSTSKKIAKQQPAGVIFCPLELPKEQMEFNEQIVNAFDSEGIPVVLLDRDICRLPKRSRYDIVSINHVRAAFNLTSHLIRLGCNKIDFISSTASTSSIEDRINGYLYALYEHGLDADPKRVHRIAVNTHEMLKQDLSSVIKQKNTQAFVCINDQIAIGVMYALTEFGVRVPDDIRVVGFDDLPYDKTLPIPLTSIKQPAEEIASEVTRTLMERISNPQLPTRDIFLSEQLIIRQSCGADLQRKKRK